MILSLLVPAVLLITVWYCTIIDIQDAACVKSDRLLHDLMRGVYVETSTGVRGVVLYEHELSVIVDDSARGKVEVLKQVIIHVGKG